MDHHQLCLSTRQPNPAEFTPLRGGRIARGFRECRAWQAAMMMLDDGKGFSHHGHLAWPSRRRDRPLASAQMEILLLRRPRREKIPSSLVALFSAVGLKCLNRWAYHARKTSDIFLAYVEICRIYIDLLALRNPPNNSRKTSGDLSVKS